MMMNKFANPSGLAATEKNKTKICNAVQDYWLDSIAIADMIGISYSRVSVLGKILADEGYLQYEDRVILTPGKKHRRRYFKATQKEYIEKEYDIKEQGKYYRPNNYYGNGEFFNPWAPQIPQGTARKVELFNDKDNDYFNQPLRKNKKTGIGSTFSLYDSYSLE